MSKRYEDVAPLALEVGFDRILCSSLSRRPAAPQTLVVSPICPHTLTNRPVIDSADHVYELAVPQPNEGTTLLVDGTSRAGIEAALVSLVRPGERVLVPVFGRFGQLLAEIALRVEVELAKIGMPRQGAG